jgi:hypothetical protein
MVRVVGRIATFRIYRVRVHATNAWSWAVLALLQSRRQCQGAWVFFISLHCLLAYACKQRLASRRRLGRRIWRAGNMMGIFSVSFFDY